MIELADLKEYLQIISDDQDTFLQKCIDNGAKYIINYCNRNFIYAEYAEKIKILTDDLYNKYFYIRAVPIDEEAGIKIEYLDDTNTWVELDTSIAILEEEGKIFIDEDLSGYKAAKITYTGGYALEDMPGDLKQACLMIAASYYNDSGQGEKRLGINARNWNSHVSEGATYKDIDEKVNIILDKYRIYNI